MTLQKIKRELETLRPINPDASIDQLYEHCAGLLRDAYDIGVEQGLGFRFVKQRYISPAQALCEVNRLLAAQPLEFLNVAQAARILGVNSNKIMSWIRSGKLPAIDSATGTRSAYRIRRADLDTLAVKVEPAKNRKSKQPDDLIDFL